MEGPEFKPQYCKKKQKTKTKKKTQNCAFARHDCPLLKSQEAGGRGIASSKPVWIAS
jgi:hypothetical protein